MIRQQKFYFLILSFYLLLSSSCTQYNDNKSVTLRLKFPTASKSSSGALTKPAGEDASYIPAFIDKIEFSLEGEDFEFTETRTRNEGNLSTEYDLGVIPWGTYSILSNAYICRYTDISICIDDEDYILTHKFSNPALVIASGYENYQIDLGMDVNYTTAVNSYGLVKISSVELDSDAISVEPINLSVSENNPPLTIYCLAVNEDGKFAIAWLERQDGTDLSILRARIFDSHGKIISDPAVYTTNDPLDILYISGSCSFVGQYVYIPYQYIHYTDFDLGIGTNYLRAVKLDPNDLDTETLEIFSTQNNRFNYQSYIDSTIDLTAISRTEFYEDSSALKADILDLEEEDTDITSVTALDGGLIYSSEVTIADKNSFIITSLVKESTYINKFIGRIFNEYGEPLTGIKRLASTNKSTIKPKYSISKTDSGYVFVYNYSQGNTSYTIRKVLLDPNLTIRDGSDTSIFKYYQNPFYIEPDLNCIRGTWYLFTWMQQVLGSSSNYSLYYILLPNVGYQITSSFEYNLVSQCGEYCSISVGSPHVAINDDGFAVISWYYDGNFYLKRFVF